MLTLSSSSNHHLHNNNNNNSVGNATSFLAAVFDPLGHSSGHRSATSTRRTRFNSNNNSNSNSNHVLSDNSESNNSFHQECCSSSPSACSDNNNHTRSDDWIDPRITKALRSAQTSLTAIVDVLQHEGVAAAAVQELRQQILHADPTMTATTTTTTEEYDLAAVLTRCQDYASVCMSSNSLIDGKSSPSSFSSVPSPSPPSAATSFQLMMACLIRAAWQTVCQYRSLQYRAAYKQFHAIRLRQKQQLEQQHHHSATKQQIATASQRQIARAEQVCAAQKGFILAAAWEQKLTQTKDARMTAGAPDTTTATTTPETLSLSVTLSTSAAVSLTSSP